VCVKFPLPPALMQGPLPPPQECLHACSYKECLQIIRYRQMMPRKHPCAQSQGAVHGPHAQAFVLALFSCSEFWLPHRASFEALRCTPNAQWARCPLLFMAAAAPDHVSSCLESIGTLYYLSRLVYGLPMFYSGDFSKSQEFPEFFWESRTHQHQNGMA
jgi:hypothetical protein